MDSTVLERIVERLTSVLVLGILVAFAYAVRESLPYVTGAMGVIVGSLSGATIAKRVQRQTVAKVMQSIHPPPNDGPHGGAPTGNTGQSAAPPPQGPRMSPFRVLVWPWVGAIVLVACTAALTPRETEFKRDVNRCVDDAKVDGGRAAYEACRASTLQAYGFAEGGARE